MPPKPTLKPKNPPFKPRMAITTTPTARPQTKRPTKNPALAQLLRAHAMSCAMGGGYVRPKLPDADDDDPPAAPQSKAKLVTQRNGTVNPLPVRSTSTTTATRTAVSTTTTPTKTTAASLVAKTTTTPATVVRRTAVPTARSQTQNPPRPKSTPPTPTPTPTPTPKTTKPTAQRPALLDEVLGYVQGRSSAQPTTPEAFPPAHQQTAKTPEQEASEVLSMHATDPFMLSVKGHEMTENRHWELGLSLLDAALVASADLDSGKETKKMLANTHNDRGVCLGSVGRHSEAFQAFRQAVAFEPQNPQFTRNLDKASAFLAKFQRPQAQKPQQAQPQPKPQPRHVEPNNQPPLIYVPKSLTSMPFTSPPPLPVHSAHNPYEYPTQQQQQQPPPQQQQPYNSAVEATFSSSVSAAPQTPQTQDVQSLLRGLPSLLSRLESLVKSQQPTQP